MGIWHIWPFSWFIRRRAIKKTAKGMMTGLTLPSRNWFTLGTAIAIASLVPIAQSRAQQAKPKLSVEERIGKTLGPILVRAALLEGANEELQAIVEQRDRTIAELKAQIESLKKPAEAPQ